MKIYTEFGFGNDGLISTEYEFDDGSEIRVNGYVISKFENPYIRIWVGRKVMVVSCHGISIKRKNRNSLKLLIGFEGGLI